MKIKQLIALTWAKRQVNKNLRIQQRSLQNQQLILRSIIRKAKKTEFGKDHNFDLINNYEDFKKNVPVRDYEGLKEYFDRIINGETDVLWPGTPVYLCKTSGTTSGTKYIPVTKDSLPNHINGARDTIFSYVAQTKQAKFLDGKMMQIQGSPSLEKKGKIKIGRLSGIVAHHVPAYLQKNRLPSMQTNMIEDWELKMNTIVEESYKENLTILGGIPIWLQNYFEKLLDKTQKKSVSEVFTNLELIVVGGVNFNPYRNTFNNLIGKEINILEVYPASEGFFAYQDNLNNEGLLLITHAGIFYEFIKVEDYYSPNPKRYCLNEVQVGINYALIINSNAGLWAYSIGDTIKFVSLDPYRIIVTGRIQHFISAFGEHIISEEVNNAMNYALKKVNASIMDFTVAPQVKTIGEELPHHEWYIEFVDPPEDFKEFQFFLDQKLQDQNEYYKNLVEGAFLQPLKTVVLCTNAFKDFMKKNGKLGGQNKVPRLSNDRTIADELQDYIIEKPVQS